MNDEISRYYSQMYDAMVASMRVVSSAQTAVTFGKKLENEHKPDGTNVTVTDYASEQAALACLQGLPVISEERGIVGAPHDRYEIWIDPVDGTRPFLNAASTSTVIVGLYDKVFHEVIGCLVGEPATGRYWRYMPGTDGTTVGYVGRNNSAPAFVYDGGLDKKKTVYVDLYPGFTKKGSHSLSDEEQARLFSTLFGKVCAVSMFGSNAIHHALVSIGRGHDVAGAITACLGGYWDVAPVILVAKAGGCVRGFSRIDGVWTEEPPLDVKRHHFTISGNSTSTVERLVDVLTSIK
jgi:fructose-1,6-bisphosphatase/inositol monophosphatase family enzyme